jgi:hypothetical protein
MDMRNSSAASSSTKAQSSGFSPVATVKHRDKRASIPTEELRHFLADEEKSEAGKPVKFYDDIACRFIDTDYNGESFFVRHACFTGAGKPYDRLKRALRAEIDEAAWSALHSTKRYPFDRPASGKIAVKVINHYRDEVVKAYEVK